MTGLLLKSDPRLKSRCREVNGADVSSLAAIVDGMLEVMYKCEGVGIAAPQVGHTIRLIVVDPSSGEYIRACRVMCNPVILEASKERSLIPEGCLSLPGEIYNVMRSNSVKVRYQDVTGASIEVELHDSEARIFLHEYDHLDGVLINDVGTRATLRHREDPKVPTQSAHQGVPRRDPG